MVSYQGKEYTLNVYKGGVTQPRPESYREDYYTAENLTDIKVKMHCDST